MGIQPAASTMQAGCSAKVGVRDASKNRPEAEIGLPPLGDRGYVDRALEVRRRYEILRNLGCASAAAKEKISKTLHGRRPRDAGHYLKFLEVADLFLEVAGKKSQYEFLREAGGGEDAKVLPILREMSVQRERFLEYGMAPDLLMRWFIASCLFARLAREGALAGEDGAASASPFTPLEYLEFNATVMRGDRIRERFLGVGLFDSAASVRAADAGVARDFFNAIKVHEGEFNAGRQIVSPASLAKSARHALSKASEDLQGAHKAEKLRAMRDNRGREHVLDVLELAEAILKKLR